MSAVLEVRDLSVTYARPRAGTHLGTGAALHAASLDVRRGEILGVVGETGSGKTTLARAAVGLVGAAAGTIALDGQDLGSLRGRALRDFRRSGRVQLVFQDPLRSLDPDLDVARLVAEPLDVAGGRSAQEKARLVDGALTEVGLDPGLLRGRTPRELSGGQRQRVSLARAIVTKPALLFCDEPVSALDVSNRNLVLNLLDRLRRDLGLAVVVIAHDLSSLAGIADRVAVFYRSRLVEVGPTRQVMERPAHPYTALLTASAPDLTRHHELRPADVLRDASHDEPRAGWVAEGGCVFAPRCRFAHDACRTQPDLDPFGRPARPDGLHGAHGPHGPHGPDGPAREVACHVAGSWSEQLTTPEKETA